jgi:ABC-type bacteriocin/lantibiotic exporter with double-glycine peptidase domain
MVASQALVCQQSIRRVLFLTLVVGLTSLHCARERLVPVEKGGPEDRDKGHYIADVPFFPQSKYQCGPAALASVLNYYGCRITPEEIAKAIYREGLKGTLSIDLMLFSREMEFSARGYRGNLADLKDHIARDHPLVVFQDLGNPLLPIRHFSVVIGYDDAEGNLILHSGKRSNKVISYRRFLKSWAKMDYWTLLVLPSTANGDSPALGVFSSSSPFS